MYDKNPALILNYHRSLLVDRQRTLRLQEAIQAVVRPGDVVLDLGCGSGILTCFACQAGARRVYAIEMGPAIELAKAICKVNGFHEQVTFIHELSTRASLPEKVDVLITETIGNFGLDEGILDWIGDARERFLKPGGQIIPQAVELFVAPLEQPTLYDKVSDWRTASTTYDLDLQPGVALSANNLHWLKIEAQDFLGQPASLLQIDLTQLDHSLPPFHSLGGKATVLIERSGVLHGIGGWFNARLTPSIYLSNIPLNAGLNHPALSNWAHAFFPFENPFPVQAGEQIEFEIACFKNGALWTWQAARRRKDGQTTRSLRQSSFAGQLLSHEVLLRQVESYRPRLSEDGEIARQVFNAVDGTKSLAELAAWLFAAYPQRFKTEDSALQFIQHICQEYALDWG